MTNEQMAALRQAAANLRAAMAAALPEVKSMNLALNWDAQQVNIQWQYSDPSLPGSPSALRAENAVCKFTDLPAAQ